MNTKVPYGLSKQQWAAITRGMEGRPGTINDYRKVVDRLHAFRDHTYSILTMTADDAAEYFRWLQEESGLAENTVHRYQATLRSIGMRMEQARDVFPGYANPFRGILKKEMRRRSAFSSESFADPKAVEAILKILPEMTMVEQMILRLMILNGFLPRHICSIAVKDFHCRSNSLSVTFSEGLVRSREEQQKKNLVRIGESSSGMITWESKATFRFFEDWEKILRTYTPDIGYNNDSRAFFMTSRHLPYTYHSIHHLVHVACEKAGLKETVTPKQLSLYGMVHSYLMETELHRHNQLTRAAKKQTDSGTLAALKEQISICESIFLPLAKLGWIGCWDEEFPPCMSERIKEIRTQLGDDILYAIVGLKAPQGR